MGPGWKGEAPAGIKKVFHSETEVVMTLTRTALLEAAAAYERVRADVMAGRARPDALGAVIFHIGYAMIFPGMTIIKILFVDIVPAFFR